MAHVKDSVIIKGRKDGLIFLLDDKIDFADVLQDLERLLSDKQAELLNGPNMPVQIQLANRQISADEEKRLRELIAVRPNLIISDIQSNLDHYRNDFDPLSSMESVSGT